MAETNLFKRRHYQSEIILLCVRWYLRYAISYRDLEEMMNELGIKSYNDLRVENVLAPSLLVVVIVPKEIDYWLAQTDEE